MTLPGRYGQRPILLLFSYIILILYGYTYTVLYYTNIILPILYYIYVILYYIMLRARARFTTKLKGLNTAFIDLGFG